MGHGRDILIFFIGLFVGAPVGLFMACLFTIAKTSEEE